MHYDRRTTVCVSTQAGCAMACGFCATGQAGFERHLSVGEIVEQVARARWRGARPDASTTWCSWGWASRWPTTTTRGRRSSACRAPWASRRATSRSRPSASSPASAGWRSEDLPVNLAVSLHAANDELRSRLVPINDRHPLAELMEACRAYIEAKRRRLSFEWALIDGVNDRRRDAAGARRPRQAARRPREPDPAQRHAGLSGHGVTARPGGHVPQPAHRPRRQRHRAPEPGHRHRRCVRAAPRRPTSPRHPGRRRPPDPVRAWPTDVPGESGAPPAPLPARMMGMETRRWTNPSQPQTLYIATFLLYANADHQRGAGVLADRAGAGRR